MLWLWPNAHTATFIPSKMKRDEKESERERSSIIRMKFIDTLVHLQKCIVNGGCRARMNCASFIRTCPSPFFYTISFSFFFLDGKWEMRMKEETRWRRGKLFILLNLHRIMILASSAKKYRNHHFFLYHSECTPYSHINCHCGIYCINCIRFGRFCQLLCQKKI